MIEVLFAESEAASMKAAKSTVTAGKTNGAAAVWLAGKKKAPKENLSGGEFPGWIPGTAQEVICLGFLLDVGNIRKPADSQYRKDLIYSIYAQQCWERNPELEADLRRRADAPADELGRLEKFLKDGEAVRVWYSDAPYSKCGFYSLCTLLQKYENDIRFVKLPEYRVLADSIVCSRNWGEICAEEFAAFLPYEKKLSKAEARMFAGLWSILVKDNSPLRAVVNGRLAGVQKDFYDFMIWKRITEKPIKEARLIGDILGCYQAGISDWWYAGRIDDFIAQGKIKVVEDSENKYARTICLTALSV